MLYTEIDLEKNEKSINEMSIFFKLLSDPTRLKILLAIGENELCVNDISLKINMTKSAVSHQLAILRQGRLIKNVKKGKEVYYSLDDDHVKSLIESAWEHVNE